MDHNWDSEVFQPCGHETPNSYRSGNRPNNRRKQQSARKRPTSTRTVQVWRRPVDSNMQCTGITERYDHHTQSTVRKNFQVRVIKPLSNKYANTTGAQKGSVLSPLSFVTVIDWVMNRALTTDD